MYEVQEILMITKKIQASEHHFRAVKARSSMCSVSAEVHPDVLKGLHAPLHHLS